ncbi:Inward rectifier potassium channel 4 [Formica fusca]
MDDPPKLFRLPGTIEEEEEKELESHRPGESLEKVESPLLGQKDVLTISSLPRNLTLIRVSTQSSSIAGGIGRQDSTRSRYRAGPTRKLRRRAVLKNGDCNVLQSRISRRSLRFLQDIFTTLVDTQWRWTLMCFILSFLLSWLGFAVIWWLIAFTHGDFEERHLPPFQVENNWTPCVYNIFSFTSCFLFSIETQHTIGYGSRSTTEECPEAIFVMCIQSISGVMIQAFMVGIVFAKMTRPKQRTQTLLFSRNAVICQRDGELCLMFRVGDMRKSHIIGASVRAQVIRSKTTKEGEVLSQHQQELMVGTDGENGDLFFIWPTIIIHRINESSPFYNMSAEDMLIERFEVVLILEGTIESTGQTTQARSSYLPQEILWGHRFDPMVSYSKERQGYEVDYSLFNSTTQVDTPLCSGRELAEFYRVQDDLRHGTDVLIDEDHLMRKQYCCNCHLTNQQHLPSFTPLDCLNSYNRVEKEYPWRYTCKYSNCTLHNSQSEGIDQAKVFDFDPNAIQIIENVELRQMPETINRLKKIVFEEKKDFLKKDMIGLNKEKVRLLKNNQEIISKKREVDFLENTLIRLNDKNTDILKNSQKIKETERVLEKKLVRSSERKDDILENTHQIHEKEELAPIKKNESRKNSSHQINYTLYKPERMHNRRCQLITLVDHDQKMKKNISFNGKQKSPKEIDKSLIDDSFTINDRRSFRESTENTINNTKNVTIMEEDKTFLNKITKYPTVSLNRSNDSLICRQRLDYDLRFRRGNGNDNISIENEKTMRSSSHRPAKIAIQYEFDSNDVCLPISPASDLSFESGFCEGSPDSSCRESYSFAKNLKKINKNMERENSNSS